MLTITEVLKLIDEGKLDGAAITPNLEESEGSKGACTSHRRVIRFSTSRF